MRAVIFDLDDTLYPERRFALSGFAAVAAHVGRRFDIPCRDAFQTMALAMRRGNRARALQALCARFRIDQSLVSELVGIIRSHDPRLRLPRQSADVLRDLRRTYRLAIVTNGSPAAQRRKIAALGLARLVDTSICASEHGHGFGKPEPAAFHAALEALHVSPPNAIVVGNDPTTDIVGARHAGIRSILVGRQRTTLADRTADSLSAVPEVVEDLFSRCPAM